MTNKSLPLSEGVLLTVTEGDIMIAVLRFMLNCLCWKAHTLAPMVSMKKNTAMKNPSLRRNILSVKKYRQKDKRHATNRVRAVTAQRRRLMAFTNERNMLISMNSWRETILSMVLLLAIPRFEHTSSSPGFRRYALSNQSMLLAMSSSL